MNQEEIKKINLEEVGIYNRIFAWLAVGLVISFGLGYYFSENVHILEDLISGANYFIVLIVPLVVAFVFKLFIEKLPPIALYILYIIFASITGVTFGLVFTIYELSSIISMFLLTSLIFAVMAVVGHVTKKDLSSFGRLLMIALIVTIIFSFINYFIFQSDTMSIGINAIVALIFVGFIAYDMQKIKMLISKMDQEKLQIYGAFELYLDFINLFLKLIQLFGRER